MFWLNQQEVQTKFIYSDYINQISNYCDLIYLG